MGEWSSWHLCIFHCMRQLGASCIQYSTIILRVIGDCQNESKIVSVGGDKFWTAVGTSKFSCPPSLNDGSMKQTFPFHFVRMVWELKGSWNEIWKRNQNEVLMNCLEAKCYGISNHVACSRNRVFAAFISDQRRSIVYLDFLMHPKQNRMKLN